ncbi:sentrin-specific protease 1 [Drosophila ficusphila]|uniref:sentrin-specific protease 1 n=1 Tax=Drosophila ficusphila TaxID=30025 RepID=UPI001C892B7D|nr:sentrin-specific protease 1 [Drosophila ficusphila]
MARSIKKYCRMIRNLWSGTESKPPESPPQNIQIQDTQESPPESIEIQDIQESPPEGTQIPDTSEVKEEAENVDHEMEQAEPTTSPLNPQTSLNQCSILFEDDNIKNSTRMSETKNQERKPVLKHPLKKFKKAKIQRLKFEKFWMDRYNNGAVKDNKVAKEQKVEHLPLTREHFERFIQLAEGPNRETLVTKFSLAVSRKEIKILLNGMWLNDMIINFYMNLLTERSENKAGQLPSVYAMNTFFLPLLLKKGHEGVKRWTRKTDLFSKDIIPVPVHCGDVHWCMAIIHMRDKSILYYDSIGKGNQPVLDALKIYIQEESMHKRNLPFNISGFRIEKAKHMPRQTNSNDCGVFSCMVAEFITRDAPLNFTQSDMDYFRRKMALEILDAKLWL